MSMPEYALKALMSSGQGGGGGQMEGLTGFLQGMFGNSGKPYEDYGREYEKYANRGMQYQNPFFQAGQRGMGNYENWLGGMKDPSGFVNNLMGGYQQSPYAKFMQNQSMNAGNNAASASGLMGSTPMMQQMQQNAGNIASQDQNQWLQNVLGVNNQYGQGQNNLMQGGQNAANQLLQLQEMLGQNMGAAGYGEQMGRNKDTGSMISGLMKFFS